MYDWKKKKTDELVSVMRFLLKNHFYLFSSVLFAFHFISMYIWSDLQLTEFCSLLEIHFKSCAIVTISSHFCFSFFTFFMFLNFLNIQTLYQGPDFRGLAVNHSLPPPHPTPPHPLDSKFHFHGKFWINLGHFSIYILLPVNMCEISGWVANSVNPDQTPHFVASDLGLHCFFFQACLSVYEE